MFHLATHQTRQNALALIFARYVSGQIAEAHWTHLADLFDAAESTSDERAAFARFYLDALSDPNEADDLVLPSVDELRELTASARI
ncbi:hypothetical protein BH23BAC4_BH23BAC4_05560 [soil metagenome]